MRLSHESEHAHAACALRAREAIDAQRPEKLGPRAIPTARWFRPAWPKARSRSDTGNQVCQACSLRRRTQAPPRAAKAPRASAACWRFSPRTMARTISDRPRPGPHHVCRGRGVRAGSQYAAALPASFACRRRSTATTRQSARLSSGSRGSCWRSGSSA